LDVAADESSGSGFFSGFLTQVFTWECASELALRAFPNEPSNVLVGEVLRVLGDFQKQLFECLEGTPDEDGLLQTIRSHTMIFRREILSTALHFAPWEGKEDSNDLPEVAFL